MISANKELVLLVRVMGVRLVATAATVIVANPIQERWSLDELIRR